MNYPELFLVPAFMLLDYYLTLVGQVLSKKVYAKYFKTESYELNPRLQSDIAKERRLSPRHLAFTCGITILLIILFESGDADRNLVRFILGCFLVSYGVLIGRHLTNIATFVSLNRNPQLIDGQITLTPAYSLYVSMASIFMSLIPLGTAAVIGGQGKVGANETDR
jgi:hypothetical protein